jgi:hypothetical protein
MKPIHNAASEHGAAADHGLGNGTSTLQQMSALQEISLQTESTKCHSLAAVNRFHLNIFIWMNLHSIDNPSHPNSFSLGPV